MMDKKLVITDNNTKYADNHVEHSDIAEYFILNVNDNGIGAVALSQMHTISSSTVLRFILYLVSLKLIATAPMIPRIAPHFMLPQS